ncbi:MAG TPA: arginase [Planctomycetota bacterium]|nr:arginase [Planctomycetota bacterium]
MSKIKIIGVPMDLGASRRGVDMGPSAMRIARIGPLLKGLGHEVADAGNIEVKIAESLHYGETEHKFLAEIAGVCRKLADEAERAAAEGTTPLGLGGDHSIAIGTVAGISRHYRSRGQKVGIIWLDAHGDINTPETSLSGNIHGMPLAHIVGIGNPELRRIGGTEGPMIDPSRAVLVGVRDLDPGERENIRKLGVRTFTMREIDEVGLRAVMQEAITIASAETAGFHVSLDVDWMDPSDAPGVGTPVWGGATYREGHLAMELIADTGKMLSMEVVEVNPVLDHENETAVLAAELILSAFGKKIL